METILSNFVGRGKDASKKGLGNNMNLQHCQTNWEYNEVFAFIKCKEAKYVAQKWLVDPRTYMHMVPLVQRWTKIVD
jgi:hypothetical protein